MMEGTEPIDELMRPVLAAIKRNVKNPDAITDIYNRAYEAVMISMDVNREETHAKLEGWLYVCQKCRGVLPPQIARYQFDYCPACGRRVVAK